MASFIVELRHTTELEQQFATFGTDPGATLDASLAPRVAGVTYDTSFSPVELPGLTARPTDQVAQEMLAFDVGSADVPDPRPEAATYLVRAELDPSRADDLRRARNVVGVYVDFPLEPCVICPGDPPLGTDVDVENLLEVAAMKQCRMDGAGVLVAVVDTGFNVAYLKNKGKVTNFDAARSWSWNPAAVTPGSAPVGHGTMCAYDVQIAAPQATLLDIALLHPVSAPPGGSVMGALLSDAIRAYRHLLNVQMAARRPGENASLVVTNSWGMFHPSWDLPPGDPGNYSDDPNHPFTRMVVTLERAGADILFAAGNCGPDCPDSRCMGVTSNAIYGANGSDSVLTIAGIDITKTRVGYSCVGPGRLSRQKPDLCGYTHFKGSGVYAADGGTSAATPVVAGVVAALRSVQPLVQTDPSTSPAAIRNKMRAAAIDLGPAGFDYLHGYGAVATAGLRPRFCRPLPPVDLCRRFPWLPWCRFNDPCVKQPWSLRCFCLRNPKSPICRGLQPEFPPFPPFPPLPERPPRPFDQFGLTGEFDSTVTEEDLETMIEQVAAAAFEAGQAAAASPSGSAGEAGSWSKCGCGCGGSK